jgi:predicted metal-dependent hydrolase
MATRNGKGVDARRNGLGAWREPFQQGRAAFNRGEFFAAHELWEESWRQLEGTERALVQGLIQIAAGLHHLQQGRRRPAGSLLAKGLQKLSRGVPAALADQSLAPFAGQVARLLAELETPGAGSPDPKLLRL